VYKIGCLSLQLTPSHTCLVIIMYVWVCYLCHPVWPDPICSRSCRRRSCDNPVFVTLVISDEPSSVFIEWTCHLMFVVSCTESTVTSFFRQLPSCSHSFQLKSLYYRDWLDPHATCAPHPGASILIPSGCSLRPVKNRGKKFFRTEGFYKDIW